MFFWNLIKWWFLKAFFNYRRSVEKKRSPFGRFLTNLLSQCYHWDCYFFSKHTNNSASNPTKLMKDRKWALPRVPSDWFDNNCAKIIRCMSAFRGLFNRLMTVHSRREPLALKGNGIMAIGTNNKKMQYHRCMKLIRM